MRTLESRNYILFLIVLLGLSVAYVVYSVPLGIISERGRFGSGLFPVVVGTLLVVLISGGLLKTLFSKTDEDVTTSDGIGGTAPRNDAGDPSDDVGDPRAAMHAIPQGDAGGAVQVLLGIACI